MGWGISSISAAPSYSLGQTFEDYSGGDKNLYAVWVRVSEPDPEPDPGPHTHRGGTATCHELAVCEVCGKTYGSLDKDNHSGGTRVVNQRPVQGSTPGYTGDTVCNGCDEVLEYGSTIEPNLPFPGESFVSGDFTFTIVSNNPLEVEVRMYNGDSRSVNVPSTASDGSLTYAVVAVGDGAFRGNTTMTSISLPSSVTSVDSYAFSDCTALESVSLPVLDKLGYSAFEGCTSLTDVRFASGFHTLEQSMFRECTALTRIDLPSSLRTIGWGAFYECSALESVDVPDGVTKVDAYSFYGCTSLKSASVPGTVEMLADSAFSRCESLIEVSLEEGLRSIGSQTFSYTAIESITLPDTLTSMGTHAFSYSELVSIEIPEGVTEIREYVFTDTPLEKVSLPSSLREIGSYAFQSCSNLKTLELNDGLERICGRTFNSSGLTTITIPASVSEIGDGPFAYCSDLTSIRVDPLSKHFTVVDGILYTKDMTKAVAADRSVAGNIVIPDGVREIGGLCFNNHRVENVALPDSLEVIGDEAFWSIGITSITIPSGVVEIGDGPFVYCHKLSEINLAPGNTSFVTVDGALYTADMSRIICVPATFSGAFEIPEGVEVIPHRALYADGITSLVIPSTVRHVENNAVSSTNLTSIVVNSRVIEYESYSLLAGDPFDKGTCYVQTIDGTELPENAIPADYANVVYQPYTWSPSDNGGGGNTGILAVAAVTAVIAVVAIAVFIHNRGKT